MNLLISYPGELLWPGALGHFLIVLSCVSAFFGALSYNLSIKQSDNSSWLSLGRIGFGLHGISTFAVIGLIFYLMLGAHFEYQYVYNHVSADLPTKYIFSAFWEGQEGSFLLWTFWHIVLGGIFVIRRDAWEAPILMCILFVNAAIVSLLLGIHVPWEDMEWKYGSNPLVLLRSMVDAPIFSNPDYLEKLDGTGLNPLLQNYWMTIHPPTLFLGFASTIIPFGYAMGALLKKDHKTWMKPALQWALFSAGILGLGILMGSVWAYEALSFGGYWAWDPVENSSFVPWIILVAGIHTHLIAKATGYSIRSTYIFYLLAFILTMYSTYLTRSGILGDTSAHAFTQMGLELQLTFLVVALILWAAITFIRFNKSIPTKKDEESLSSREFWMFIGSVVLFFSAALIISSTSLPVINALVRNFYNPNFTGHVIEDPIEHYNKYQIWIAVLIAILSAVAQFLRYNERNFASYAKKIGKHLGIIALLALILGYIISGKLFVQSTAYSILVFSAVFAILSNLDYLFFFIKLKLKSSASVLSHMGFGVLILGILFSGLNKEFLTQDQFRQFKRGTSDTAASSVQLFEELPYYVNDYWIEFQGDTVEGNLKVLDIEFTKVDSTQKILDNFKTHPSAIFNSTFSKIGAWNPSTKHYWNKDIFTSITAYPRHLLDVEDARKMEENLVYQQFYPLLNDTISVQEKVYLDKDSFIVEDLRVVPERFVFEPEHPEIDLDSFDFGVGVEFSFHHKKRDSVYRQTAVVSVENGFIKQYPLRIEPLGVRVLLNDSILPQFFHREADLEYERMQLKQGQTIQHKGNTIVFESIQKPVQHPDYKKEEGDIAVQPVLKVIDANGNSSTLKPIYLIRENRALFIKSYDYQQGIHIKLVNINPNTELFTLDVAYEPRQVESVAVPFKIAANVPRSDYIVMEAIIFPWINLVWLGTLMMLSGFFLSAYNRRKAK